MKTKFILIVTLTLSSYFTAIYSQEDKTTADFNLLDKSFFKWKEFSFIQSWENLKKICYLGRIEIYPDEYLNFYCGDISESAKSYFLRNNAYREFNGKIFDKVILHVEGLKNSDVNHSSLYFIKHLNDSISAKFFNEEILKSFKAKYGNRYTNHLEKYKEDVADSINSGEYLNENNPFSAIEETEWQGNNIYTTLNFIKESNLIIFSVKEYIKSNLLNNSKRNLFFEFEYDENSKRSF